MLNPKQRFLRNKRLTEVINDVTTSSDFQAAADASLLQLIQDQPDTTDPVLAAAAYHRIRGAKLFLEKLQTISDQPKPVAKKAVRDNLEQNR